MHVLVLASLPSPAEQFNLQPSSFCAATPGEPLRGLTRVTERGQQIVYAIGSVSHKASSRLLVTEVDTTEEHWTVAVLNSWERAFPGITQGKDRQATRTEIRDMLALAAEWPVGTEVHFQIPPPGMDGTEVVFTEASDVTRIIAGDLGGVTARMITALRTAPQDQP